MRVGNVKEIVFSKDPKQMNWLREEFPYAEVKCPPEFSAEFIRNHRTMVDIRMIVPAFLMKDQPRSHILLNTLPTVGQ